MAADPAIGWPPGDVYSPAVEQYFDGNFAYASVADTEWGRQPWMSGQRGVRAIREWPATDRGAARRAERR